jgi:hypothetical protein
MMHDDEKKLEKVSGTGKGKGTFGSAGIYIRVCSIMQITAHKITMRTVPRGLCQHMSQALRVITILDKRFSRIEETIALFMYQACCIQ